METRDLKSLAETQGQKIAHWVQIVLGWHQIMPFQLTGAQAWIDGKDYFLWPVAAGRFVEVAETLTFVEIAAEEIR